MAGTTDAPSVETMWLRTEGGTVMEIDVRAGTPIAARLAKGEITRVANADGDPYVEPATPVDAGTELVEPAGNASKADWVDYAVSKGADRAEAEACTRDDLRKSFGSPPAED